MRFVVQLVSTVDKILTDIAYRAVCLQQQSFLCVFDLTLAPHSAIYVLTGLDNQCSAQDITVAKGVLFVQVVAASYYLLLVNSAGALTTP